MKYTYLHNPLDKNLICVETHEIVVVELPPIEPINTYGERVKENEMKAIEIYEAMLMSIKPKYVAKILNGEKTMERLTIEQIKQFPLTTYGRMIGKQLATQVMNELIAYKQIEQELGISLEVLFKALKNGVYLWNENREIIFSKIEHFVPCMDKQLHTRGIDSIIHGVYSRQREKHLAIKDYGETWALTKEELL